jgi:hypothetical protein
LVVEAGEQALRLSRGFVGLHRELQEFVTVSLQDGIHAQADRILHVQAFAGLVDSRPSEAGIGT